MSKMLLVFDGCETLKEYCDDEIMITINIPVEGKDGIRGYHYHSTRSAVLKPVPQKKEVKGDFYKQREIATEMNDLIDFDKGYNKCIDEILGDEDGKNYC